MDALLRHEAAQRRLGAIRQRRARQEACRALQAARHEACRKRRAFRRDLRVLSFPVQAAGAVATVALVFACPWLDVFVYACCTFLSTVPLAYLAERSR